MHDSRGIEIVNFTILLALSVGTLMASAGTPYRLVPAHFYPCILCIDVDIEETACTHSDHTYNMALVYLSYRVFVCMQISHALYATKCLNKKNYYCKSGRPSDLTDVDDAFSRPCLSPDVQLFTLHVLKSSLVKHYTNHALNTASTVNMLRYAVDSSSYL